MSADQAEKLIWICHGIAVTAHIIAIFFCFKMKAPRPIGVEGDKRTCREVNAYSIQILALKPLARLEDLHVWKMEKTKATKKGSRKYAYCMATWREGGKVRNVHLRSCGKMSEETARQNARMMKAAALGI